MLGALQSVPARDKERLSLPVIWACVLKEKRAFAQVAGHGEDPSGRGAGAAKSRSLRCVPTLRRGLLALAQAQHGDIWGQENS